MMALKKVTKQNILLPYLKCGIKLFIPFLVRIYKCGTMVTNRVSALVWTRNTSVAGVWVQAPHAPCRLSALHLTGSTAQLSVPTLRYSGYVWP